jgi:DNA-binding response OmpR family regulator
VNALVGNNILLIDDDPLLGNLLEMAFRREGATLLTAGSGRSGLRLLYEARPDLAIIDVCLPDVNGLDLCRRARELSDIPLVILSSIGESAEMVRGLNVGADNYLVKPVDPVLLASHCAALLRRAKSMQLEAIRAYDDGYLVVDLTRRAVWRDRERMTLTQLEFDLLAMLVRRADHVCTFEQIIHSLWQDASVGGTESIHTLVWQLRRKLEPDPHRPIYLISEHSVGYRFQPQNGES